MEGPPSTRFLNLILKYLSTIINIMTSLQINHCIIGKSLQEEWILLDRVKQQITLDHNGSNFNAKTHTPG